MRKKVALEIIWMYEFQISHLIKKRPTYIYDINVISVGSWVYTDVVFHAKKTEIIKKTIYEKSLLLE